MWEDLRDYRILEGDCIQKMKELESCSIDAIVTDPPYGIGFMNKKWDCAVPGLEWARECLRVLKPGGHIIAFSSTRTVHRLGVAIEDAGFEIRDTIHWCYFSGFPKSHDISKAIDRECIKNTMYKEFALHFREQRKKSKLTQKDIAKYFPSKTGGLTGCVWNWENGANVPTLDQWQVLQPMIDLSLEYLPLIERVEAEREVVGKYNSDMGGLGGQRLGSIGGDITKPATKDAQKWEGYGTALKPAIEPAVLARKPIEKGLTIAQNVLKYGTGAINIDACRFGYGDPCWMGEDEWKGDPKGNKEKGSGKSMFLGDSYAIKRSHKHPEGRWPANLYQCAKASRAEREAGLEHLKRRTAKSNMCLNDGQGERFDGRESPEVANFHPTVKPIKLMRWLCRLIGGQKGATILDTFCGSGTTGCAAILEGFDFVGIEITSEYLPIIKGRLDWAKEEYKRENAQLDLFEDAV